MRMRDWSSDVGSTELKATVEMERSVAGKRIEVAGAEGDLIAIGSPLVVIEIEGEGNENDKAPSPMTEVVEERIEAETPETNDVERTRVASASPESDRGAEPSLTSASAPAEPVERSLPTPAGFSSSRSQPVARGGGSSAKFLASPAVRKRASDRSEAH